ncbi:hypothetical protein [Desulfonatronospira sp.]|uniref:hypothetical protein n=1 Tax=Desulfonatronospira sp. TaxID=1962951 RepID=UPI0025C6AF2A|nr:hypothetical protein [Desulfonatronospira sp.]
MKGKNEQKGIIMKNRNTFGDVPWEMPQDRTIPVSYRDVSTENKLRKKLNELKTVRKKYIEKYDSLVEENNTLRARNEQLANKLKELYIEYKDLNEDYKELEDSFDRLMQLQDQYWVRYGALVKTVQQIITELPEMSKKIHENYREYKLIEYEDSLERLTGKFG